MPQLTYKGKPFKLKRPDERRNMKALIEKFGGKIVYVKKGKKDEIQNSKNSI